MALIRGIAFLLIASCAASPAAFAAQAARREPFSLAREGCTLRVKVRGQWVASDARFKAGQSVLGAFSNGAILFFYDGKEYSGDPACWASSRNAAGQAAASGGSGRGSGGESRNQVGLIYLNWQERTSLVATATGTSYPLRANQAGYGIYYHHERTLPGRPQGSGRMGLMASLFTAGSAVLTSTADASALGNLTYKSLDASVFGVSLAPELGWEREGGGPALGVSLPLAYRFTNWASPPDYEIQGSKKLLIGGLLSVRLRRPGWEVSSRLGFLQSTQNLAWILGFGRIL